MSEIGIVADDVLSASDFILLVDHSGSMEKPSARFKGKNRLQEVEEDASRIAYQAGKFDDDGLTLIHFSSRATAKDGVTGEAIENVFKEFKPGGSTNTDSALQLAIDKVRSSTKNCIIVIFTDGGADDEPAVIKTLRAAATEFGRPRIGFVFIQVGSDDGAVKFLAKLDAGLGDDVPDIVAVVSDEQAEDLSIANLAWLAQNA